VVVAGRFGLIEQLIDLHASVEPLAHAPPEEDRPTRSDRDVFLVGGFLRGSLYWEGEGEDLRSIVAIVFDSTFEFSVTTSWGISREGTTAAFFSSIWRRAASFRGRRRAVQLPRRV
jgi:hypothetical protein